MQVACQPEPEHPPKERISLGGCLGGSASFTLIITIYIPFPDLGNISLEDELKTDKCTIGIFTGN